MADAAISFAAQKLGDALIDKVKFLKGVEEHVRWLKDELKSMQCFVKDAVKKQGNDQRIRKWISDVREVAQDAEDVIENFNLNVDTPRRKRSLLRRCACFPVHVSHLNKVGEEIESIRSRLDEIGKRRERYGIGNLGESGMDSSSRRRWEMVEWRRRMAARFQKDRDVVGLNEDADLLLNKVILRDDMGGLCVAAVVGMGGIGKSTLARKIYNHPSIGARFEWRAWVVVSSEFAAEDIMKQIMMQLPITLDPEKLKELESIELEDESKRPRMIEEALQQLHHRHMDRLKVVETVNDKLRRQEMLQEMLRQRLEGKRYFIVLDDVWEHAHWEALTTAFPDEQGKASRVMFTSRNQIITARKGYIHKMRLLNPEEGWELLLKTALTSTSEGRCPPELEQIGREILKKCHGLPLAITIAGGLLVNQDETERGWEKVLKQMKDYHLESSEIGTNVSAILELSYHNLPSQLKPCFLTLGLFKEDAIIRAKMLVHIWVAQGFIELQAEAGEETEEEIAAGYLDELMRRNLVQVKDMTVDGRVNYCGVHDLLWELSIKKATEEIGFETLICDRISSTTSSYKPRHRVVRGVGERLFMIDSSNQNNHIRSLFLHIEGRNDAYLITPSYWKTFQLLRILDIEGARFPSLPSTICALIGLRYLRLREVGTLTLPSWLSLLINLQVLDIADCERVKLPDVTWNMDSLRHLYIHSNCIFSNPMKMSTWKNLETLKYMRSDNLRSDNPIEAFSRRLRKLGIQLTSRNSDPEFGRLLAKSQIEVLHIRWSDRRYDLPFLNSLEHLSKLKLHGLMGSCSTVKMLPPNICHLALCGTRIYSSDLFEELGKLPKLQFLSFEDDAIESGSSMRVLRDGFPRLKVLRFKRMHKWSGYTHVEEGGMSKLQRLEIYQCTGLNISSFRQNLRSVEITVVDD